MEWGEWFIKYDGIVGVWWYLGGFVERIVIV